MAVLETLEAVVEKSATVIAEGVEKGVEGIKNVSEAGIKEVARQQVENIKNSGDAVLSKLDEIKNLTPGQLRERMEENIDRYNSERTSEAKETNEKTEGLTDEEKAKIKEETGWSDEIIECIQNMEQYEILKNAGLKEVEVNGRKCLIKENIDLDYADDDGITNRDRITRGLAPLDSKTGKSLELHHLGQKVDSPLVELTEEEHRTGEYKDGKKNQSLWHDNTIETEVHGEGNNWDDERKEHWKARSNQI